MLSGLFISIVSRNIEVVQQHCKRHAFPCHLALQDVSIDKLMLFTTFHAKTFLLIKLYAS